MVSISAYLLNDFQKMLVIEFRSFDFSVGSKISILGHVLKPDTEVQRNIGRWQLGMQKLYA